MIVLLLFLAFVSGANAVLSTEFYTYNGRPRHGVFIVAFFIALSIILAFEAGEMTGSDCDNASIINQRDVK